MGTASTAPLAGRGRPERLSVVRFVRRAFGAQHRRRPGSVERRAFWRFALVIPIANFCGAIDVFAFLWWVLPLPEVQDLGQVRMVNIAAFAVHGRHVRHLRLAGEQVRRPDRALARLRRACGRGMVRRVLRFPFNQTVISMGAWAASRARCSRVLNATYSLALGVLVGVAILLGGVTTCGMMYLLAEKAFAPISARALRSLGAAEARAAGSRRARACHVRRHGRRAAARDGGVRDRRAVRGRRLRRPAGADDAGARRSRRSRPACCR